MDTIDRRILALYQGDTRRTADSIGSEVGLSAAAVQRRLKRLRETGVIRGEVALVDPAAAGVPILCVVMLTMRSRADHAPEDHLTRFKQAVKSDPEVQQCYHVTGSSDMVLIVSAASMEAYGEFANRWFETNKHVARYETHVVLDRVKVGLSLPLR